MRHFLFLLLLTICPVFVSVAQKLKPCGTSVLARRHTAPQRTRPLTRSGDERMSFTGEKRGLIILVEFQDVSFRDSCSNQVWTDVASLPGYEGQGAPGSVSDYFHDQSYGQFQLTFDVVGPVKAKHDHAYYGANKDWGAPIGWFDQNVGEFVEEACRAVADSVTFSDYDWDSDGEVDQVFLLYAGHGENDYYYADSTTIWPHMGSLTDDWDYDGGLVLQDTRINIYACSNEISRNGSLAGMGTICHEFSHCLGLRDLYDTEHGTSVVGRYDLMDSGSYNGPGNNGWCPAGYSSYERYACGWLMPEPVDSVKTDLILLPLHETPDVRLYRTSPDANDYYLLEYRRKTSWDSFLPSEGLMAWHIDYDEWAWWTNTVNNDPKHLRVERMPVEKIPTSVATVKYQDCRVVGYYDLYGRRLPGEPSVQQKRCPANCGTPVLLQIHQ